MESLRSESRAPADHPFQMSFASRASVRPSTASAKTDEYHSPTRIPMYILKTILSDQNPIHEFSKSHNAMVGEDLNIVDVRNPPFLRRRSWRRSERNLRDALDSNFQRFLVQRPEWNEPRQVISIVRPITMVHV